MLSAGMDPEAYNRQVIWPDKVRINKDYMKNWSFFAVNVADHFVGGHMVILAML